ncbi:hypothetical protein HPB49_008278 [Dermacentor silvarum]|uniref:Uncharacterized protein n=1 Tax=Dermacentor silvarum TaxID=543639 RepID=A0ACB8DNR8_DERSI|nr:hypothetical protein HPB49_008278 [Dermacentor silvarum]
MSFLTPSLRWCMESQWVGSILKQCEQHDCCCGCCAALRPRYKRLVDNIFPANPELPKSNTIIWWLGNL